MKVVCLGGGPAGLYAAIMLKKANPAHEITVFERNRPNDTFGWGIVFSDKTMENFRQADAETHGEIVRNFHHWDDIHFHFKGHLLTSTGHGFCGIARLKLLNILQARAEALGVRQAFEHEIVDPRDFTDADLVIAADGVNSVTRNRYSEHFEPDVDVRRCRYIWLGTHQRFPAFTYAFEPTEWGWFQAHMYQFSSELSTVIVETREETWLAAGLDRRDTEGSIAFCEKLFGRYLGGHKLMSNARHLRGSAWLRFNRVLCRRWHHENVVLIGDAAHTAHFTIGSGTKLAMEDAMALSRALDAAPGVEKGLEIYQEERELEALRLQNAARNRMEWFEHVDRYARLEPEQMFYSMLTSSQRIGHANLKLRDPAYISNFEEWMKARTGTERPVPPMFLPFRLRAIELANRIVVSPMAQYSAHDGMPGDWHLVHLGARAAGGAGLVITEMTCVSPEGRISPGCTGLWNEAQRDAWRRIVDFVHRDTRAKICLQLGHSGRKGSTQLGWQEMDHPLAEGNWPLLAPSPLPYLPGVSQVPREMSRADMRAVLSDFVRAAQLGAESGFDMIELHMAHGYLLASFISPLTNQREDGYGGPIEARMRFPLEVLHAVREVWPQERPISVRISATDWAPGGLPDDDLLALARMLKEAGVDLIDVSAGQTVPDQRPVYGRMFQTPFADEVRNEIGIATMAVGNIFEADHANSIVAAGRADLVALARPHLANPHWTLAAAAELGYAEQWWPPQYLSAKAQLERNIARAGQMIGAV
jgi:anthraniloyl-CoA monooxygenase